MIDIEHLLAGAIGMALGVWLLTMAMPDFKKDCDSYGITRFGSTVYVCKRADQR